MDNTKQLIDDLKSGGLNTDIKITDIGQYLLLWKDNSFNLLKREINTSIDYTIQEIEEHIKDKHGDNRNTPIYSDDDDIFTINTESDIDRVPGIHLFPNGDKRNINYRPNKWGVICFPLSKYPNEITIKLRENIDGNNNKNKFDRLKTIREKKDFMLKHGVIDRTKRLASIPEAAPDLPADLDNDKVGRIGENITEERNHLNNNDIKTYIDYVIEHYSHTQITYRNVIEHLTYLKNQFEKFFMKLISYEKSIPQLVMERYELIDSLHNVSDTCKGAVLHTFLGKFYSLNLDNDQFNELLGMETHTINRDDDGTPQKNYALINIFKSIGTRPSLLRERQIPIKTGINNFNDAIEHFNLIQKNNDNTRTEYNLSHILNYYTKYHLGVLINKKFLSSSHDNLNDDDTDVIKIFSHTKILFQGIDITQNFYGNDNVNNHNYLGMCNIGVRPTFYENGNSIIE